jgi:hypothetical protein
MPVGRVVQLARLGAGLREYLASTVELAAARRRIRRRLEQREERFLEAARRLIYGHARSPYRRLLAIADCEYGDLEAGVRGDGLEATLERLWRAGAYVSLDELKGKKPIVRAGQELEATEADFDSPLLLGRGMTGTTSGSRSPRSRIQYDWHGLAEEADNALLLDAIHGVAEAPLALWFPAPPGVAGLRNVLISAKCGRPAERWFSQVPGGLRAGPTLTAVSFQYLRWLGWRMGIGIPNPEHTPLEGALRVARWLAPRRSDPLPRTLRTVTSSAVRVARSALAEEISLEPATAVIGGEPLNTERRQLIESSGLRVVNRYATAEAGIVAASCGHEPTSDAMHVYTDRAAALQSPHGLLLTSLSPFAGKVLFNASLGDQGELRQGHCDCGFGKLGMSSWLSRLGSDERVTIEGMTLRLADLHAVVTRALALSGVGPDECQLWTRSKEGATRLAVAVAPRIGVEPAALLDAILEELGRQGEVERLTAAVWSQAGALEIVVADPRVNAGQKLLPAVEAL